MLLYPGLERDNTNLSLVAKNFQISRVDGINVLVDKKKSTKSSHLPTSSAPAAYARPFFFP